MTWIKESFIGGQHAHSCQNQVPHHIIQLAGALQLSFFASQNTLVFQIVISISQAN